MSSESNQRELAFFETGIDSFDRLFPCAGKAKSKGIAYHPDTGFFGVVFGCAGSGKSIFGLQIATSCLRQELRRGSRPYVIFLTQESSALLESKITAFGFLDKEPRIHDPRGGGSCYLEDHDKHLHDDGLHLVHFSVSSKEQREILTNVLNLVLQRSTHYRNDASSRDSAENGTDSASKTGNGTDDSEGDGGSVHRFMPLIIIDNAETLADEAILGATTTDHSLSPEDCRATNRSDQNFYKHVRSFCGKHGINVIMLFEESPYEGQHPHQTAEKEAWTHEEIATTGQAYAADWVVRLGYHIFAGGYKQRSIEVLKAKSQFHRRGRHHFSIVGALNSTASNQERKRGIVIYPALTTQLYDLRTKPLETQPEANHATDFGVEELDLKIKRTKRSDSDGGSKDSDGFLDAGTVSVLVSDLDVKAQELALHFAFRPEELRRKKNAPGERDGSGERDPSGEGDPSREGGPSREKDSSGEKDPSREKDPSQPPVNVASGYSNVAYISFHHTRDQLFGALERFFPADDTFENHKKLFERAFRHFAPEHIPEAKLVQDISEFIRSKKHENADGRPLRVVIDSLYALTAHFPLVQDTNHFITSLFAIFRGEGVTALVLDIVEVGEGSNPLGESFAAGLGENVFLLRHVELHSEPHVAFSVLKLLGHDQEETLFHIVNEPFKGRRKLKAKYTFEFYKHVLSGNPESVNITMSLHSDEEDSPLHGYYVEKESALSKLAGRSIKMHFYQPDQYEHVYNALTLSRDQPFSDCHVIAIDETWIETLIRDNLIEDMTGLMASHPDFKKDHLKYRHDYVTTAHDLALAKIKRIHSNEEKFPWYAFPDRNNCGVLAIDVDIKSEAQDESLSVFIKDLEKNDELSITTWEALKSLVVELNSKNRNEPSDSSDGIREPYVFTFCRDQPESCVSFLLEIALSHLKGDDFLVHRPSESGDASGESGPSEQSNTERLNWDEDIWLPTLLYFLEIVDFRDLKEIAENRFRPSREEPPALISRQWFNTWAIRRRRLDKLHVERETKSLRVFRLPKGGRGVPCTVSGAWYLGVLKGSIAGRAGVETIKQLTGEMEDLSKTNRSIGLPVLRHFYESTAKDTIQVIEQLPYRRRFCEISEKLQKCSKDRQPYSKMLAEINEHEFPFYRQTISCYPQAVSILWGLMVKSAGLFVHGETNQLEAGLRELIQSSRDEYTAICERKEQESLSSE